MDDLVRMHMLHMLGLLAETFPLEITGKDGTILSIYLSNLKTEVGPPISSCIAF